MKKGLHLLMNSKFIQFVSPNTPRALQGNIVTIAGLFLIFTVVIFNNAVSGRLIGDMCLPGS